MGGLLVSSQPTTRLRYPQCADFIFHGPEKRQNLFALDSSSVIRVPDLLHSVPLNSVYLGNEESRWRTLGSGSTPFLDFIGTRMTIAHLDELFNKIREYFNRAFLRAVVWQNVDFIGGSKKKTFDVTCRFLMLDMQCKALSLAISLG